MTASRRPLTVTGLVFVASFALYLRTTAPTLGGGWDSEEFQHVAYTLGIAHSTGYPLYLLLGKIVTTLVPIGNVAYRMNLLSAMIGALTAVVVYLNALTLTQRQISAMATTALFATNVAVWRQAGVASVGPLNLFLLATIIYALVQWRVRRAPLTLVSFLFGLSLAHHRTTLFLLPTIVLLVWLTDSNIIHRPRELMRNLIFLVAPLAFYLYLPIFGNHSPWYSNTLDAFIHHIAGSEAGNYTRATLIEITQAFTQLILYLHDSLGYWSVAFILIGIVSVFSRRHATHDTHLTLFLGLGWLTYVAFATLVAGEPDRYLVLPFFFAMLWFALGVGAVETFINTRFAFPHKPILFALLSIILTLLVILPFPPRFHLADWSTFDRVYKTWDEIFTLPIPPNATIVGNWGQLNAMRYMQRIEHRRTDLQIVGTQDDPAPQTIAAQNAFDDGRAIFLAPGIALPMGEYRYAQLGPLLEVRDKPQMRTSASPKNISINLSLTLANFEITTALEPYALTTSVAPNRTVRITLDWHAKSSVQDFLVRIKLLDPENRIIAQKDEPPVRGLYPATQWQPGEYLRDVHNLQIPAGTPPGPHTLQMQTLDAQTKMPTSGEIVLGSFAIERTTNLTRDQVFIARPLDLPLNHQIRLLGYGGFEGKYRAGENISGNLIFFVQENITFDLTLRFELVDASGAPVQTWERAPITFYPTREWRRGEILKAYFDLPLSQSLPSGEHTFSVGIESTQNILNKIQIAP